MASLDQFKEHVRLITA